LYRIIFYFLSALCLWSCNSNSEGNNAPVISFSSLSKNTIVQDQIGLNDSIDITINFEDNDGDLGFLPEDAIGQKDVFIIDNRTGNTYQSFRLPHFPTQGASNGIEGQITFTILSACCIFPDGIPPCEAPAQYPTNEFTMGLYLTDRAGNQSNTIETSTITMICD